MNAQPLTVTGPWQYSDNYDVAYAPTNDPRIVALIERDAQPTAPWGDVMAPAYFVEYLNAYTTERAGETFHDDASDALAARYAEALDRFAYRITHTPSDRDPGYLVPKWTYDARRAANRAGILDRWLRIFHDAQVRDVDRRGANYGTDARVLIFDTPTYRAHVGTAPLGSDKFTDSRMLDGDAQEWRNYLEGDVFGVGYAVHAERTTEEQAIDLTEPEWEREVLCWGHYGETYAKESAGGFYNGTPDLAPMIDGTAPALAGVTA